MKISTVAVLVMSSIMLGFCSFLVSSYDESASIADMDDRQPPCATTLAYYADRLGKVGIAAALMGVPAYFGKKLRDDGVLLEIFSGLALYMLYMEVFIMSLASDGAKLSKSEIKDFNTQAKLIASFYKYTDTELAKMYVEKPPLVKNLTDAVDIIQQINRCCGVTGPKDYQKLRVRVPVSCCIAKGCNPHLKGKVFNRGCAHFLLPVIDYTNDTKRIVLRDDSNPATSLVRKTTLLLAYTIAFYLFLLFARIWPDTNDLI